jgi:F-box protein 9
MSATEALVPAVITAHTDRSAEESNELWFREEERWELTWPIWHMLPRHERKALAQQHGYSTIGEFEEFMTLQRAFGDSNDTARSRPDENNWIHSSERSSQGKKKIRGRTEDKDADDNSYSDEMLEKEIDCELAAAAGHLSIEELLDVGGQILMIPDDILHKVFEWLPVDAYGTLSLVSPHWKAFTRTEAVYKRLCERLYLNQSKRRALHVSRFGNSYRAMLELRPRVRAGGGIYVLKFVRVKKIQRDMWTEIPVGAVLETVYYRYLYFQEDGRVLYALTAASPHEMFRRFLKVCLTRQPDKAAVWGTYEVSKSTVTINARQAWQYVRLEVSIQPESVHGRNGLLRFDRHMASSIGDFDDWSRDRTVFEVPSEPFRFVKDRRL